MTGRNQPMMNLLARLGGMVPGELPKSGAAIGIAGGIGKLFFNPPAYRRAYCCIARCATRQGVMSRCIAAVAIGLLPCAAVAQNAPAITTVPVCIHDVSVVERFLPVELLTGNLMTDSRELIFPPVDRVYPYFVERLGAAEGSGEVVLKGPMRWEGEGGKVYEIYERKVPRAHERFALTPDRTAIGRVFDERFGNATNEGKFPVGLWKQDQKRNYYTTYHTPSGNRAVMSTVQIEKLSCVYEGVAGAIQYGWKTNSGLSYGYIYAPGKGLVHVIVRSPGR